MKIAAIQCRSSLLDRQATTSRIVAHIHAAADAEADLVVFPEACLPGYPVWLSRTGGAEFDAARQKAIHARYVDQSVAPVHGHLESICAAAAVREVQVVVGAVERGTDRGGHSLFCTAFWIDAEGHLVNSHRKLVPTYEERLCWAPGDGHGLRTRAVDGFRVGALNCWENWMPMARAALQADGLDVHLMLWPGAPANTADLTRVVAREGRCYAISVCGVLNSHDVPADLPELSELRDTTDEAGNPTILQAGGSCIAAPDGTWIVPPDQIPSGEEGMLLVDIEADLIHGERQNFDVAGHYSRPDVLHLTVDRRRQGVASFLDDETPSVTPSGAPLIDSIEHLVLTVRDPDHAVRFYRRVLGFEEVRHDGDVRSLQFGSQRLELRTEEDDGVISGSRPTWGSTDLCLVSRAPIEDWLEHLRRFGIPIALGPVNRPGTTGPLRSIHFRDPDGNMVEIANRQPKRSHDTPPPPGR